MQRHSNEDIQGSQRPPSPPRRYRYADVHDIAAKYRAEKAAQQVETTAARLKSRAANAERRGNVVLPKIIPLAALYWPIALNWVLIPERLRWYVAYFIHLIRWRYVIWRANLEGFSQLHNQLLTRVIPKPILAEVKRLLIDELKVVECDGMCVKGSKALGYRLTPPYRKTSLLRCTDEAFNRKLARVYAREQQNHLPVHRWLAGKLDLMEFDLDGMLRIVAALEPRKRKTTVREYRERRADYVRLVASGHSWFTVDPYGRVHTPLTSLERRLRPCLSVGGAPLVSFDLVNSQPLLLAYLLRQFQQSTRDVKGRFLKRTFSKTDPYRAVEKQLSAGAHAIYDSKRPVFAQFEDNPTTGGGKPVGFSKNADKSAGLPQQQTHSTQHPTHNIRIKRDNRIATPSSRKELGNTSPAQGGNRNDDLETMITVCEAGTFYESLMTEKELAGGPAYRRRIKVRFYRWLFGRNQPDAKHPNQIGRRFRRKYPTAAKVLKELKARNYKHSSHLLQNYEAAVFIGQICWRIMKERPAVPLFTIHDSLLTTPEHADFVRTIMMEEFRKVGVNPKLKREDYR